MTKTSQNITVIGAGINGLVVANYLVSAGYQVPLLDGGSVGSRSDRIMDHRECQDFIGSLSQYRAYQAVHRPECLGKWLGIPVRALLRLHHSDDDLRPSIRRRLRLRVEALTGHVRAHHRFRLAELLTHMDELNQQLGQLNERIEQQTTPHEALVARLDEIPGVGRHTAEILLAEIGCNVGSFPSEKHLASWACLCPGNNISANKRGTGKTRKGQK